MIFIKWIFYLLKKKDIPLPEGEMHGYKHDFTNTKQNYEKIK